MATYIRRGLTRLVESQKAPKPAALTFARPEGTVTLNAREAARYGMLMTMLDSDGDNEIGGMEGASFLRRSGLDVGEARRRAATSVRSRVRAAASPTASAMPWTIFLSAGTIVASTPPSVGRAASPSPLTK